MNKKILVLVLVCLFLVGLPVVSTELSINEQISFNDKQLNVTIKENETTIQGKIGVTEFDTKDNQNISFKSFGDNIKYDIDFTNSNLQNDWYGSYIKSVNPIQRIGSISYLIDGYEHSFLMFYEETNCVDVYYSEADVTQNECEYVPKVSVEQLTDNVLKVGWRPVGKSDYVYDPIISDWDDGNRTAYFDFEEGSGTVLIDGTSGSTHNGTEVNTHAGNYVTDTPNGTGYAGNLSATSYYNLDNYADFGDVSEFEISFAIKHQDLGSSVGYNIFSADNSDIRIKTHAGRLDAEIATSGTNCQIQWFEYSSFLTNNQWYFLNFAYNGTHCSIIENATNVKRSEAATGVINNMSSYARIGKDDTVEWEGLIDCVSIYAGNTLNESARITARDSCGNFSIVPVVAVNNIDKEVYVSKLSYIIPRNETLNNSIIYGEPLMINFTINNSGVNATDLFNYSLVIDDSIICGDRINITGETDYNVSCNWTSTFGFTVGEIRLDYLNEVVELDENNSNKSVWLPMINRPFSLNLSEWNETLFPFAINSSNDVAYDSYNWFKTFLSEDFDNGWGAGNIDPRGKKGRENAVGCLVNNYNMSYAACTRARNHLFGWANRTDNWADESVQSTHELIQLGVTYDLMYPTLNSTDRTYLSEQYDSICQQITNDDNTNPYADDINSISGGNGKGFGTGLGAFCFLITGEYVDNAGMLLTLNDTYLGYDINDAWNGRITRYLKSGKNDSESMYQEGTLYKWYSQYHLVDLLVIFKEIGFTNIYTPYQNYLNAMAKENLYIILDHSYNGDTIRGDEDNIWRSIPLGDTNSYEIIGGDGLSGWGILTYYGLLSSEQSVKEALLALRLLGHSTGEQTRSANEVISFAQLREQSNVSSDITSYQKFFYDNANDRVTWRDNYSYENDTVFMVDGGEERGGGHSQVQGFYLYALGEPFLDFGEVPNEDDIRQESWRNVLTYLYNATAQYNDNCGDFATYYYFGSNDCVQQGSYPDFQDWNKTYSGDLTNSFGSSDGKKGGTHKWTPIRTTTPTHEFFVLFDDLMVRRVTGSSPSGSVVDSNLNILGEFPNTVSGGNISFNRSGTNKHLDVDLIYSNITMTALTGNTTLNISNTKTGVPAGIVYYQNISLYGSGSDVDFIRSYAWFLTGNKSAVTVTGTIGQDRGATQDNKFIIFDTDNDNDIQHNGYYSNGWSLAYDNTTQRVMSFNATNISMGSKTILNTNTTVSAFITETSNVITVELNTMQLANYIDAAVPVNVTINANNLTNNSNFIVQKNNVNITSSESGTLVMFTATTDQNGDTYTITAELQVNDTTPPTWIQTPVNQSTFNNTLATYNVNATDGVGVDKYQIINNGNFTINSGSGLITVATRIPNNYSVNISVNDTTNNVLTKVINWEIKNFNYTSSTVDVTCLSINNSTIAALGGVAALIGILVVVIVGLFFYNMVQGNDSIINDLPIMVGVIVFTMILVGVGIVIASVLGGLC